MLRNRSLIGLFVAEIVSLTGSSMTLLALPWFVLATTGSASKMGWVLAARLAPQALFGIPAGSLVARLGAKRTMLVSDAARGPLMAIIPILWWTGHLSFAALLAATFAVGLFSAPYSTSSALIVPDVVGDDERLVARAGAIVGTSGQITQVLGPVLAGALISVTSPATFLFSFLTIASVVRAGKRMDETPQSRGLLAGVRFLMRDPLLGPVVAVAVACALNAVVLAAGTAAEGDVGADHGVHARRPARLSRRRLRPGPRLHKPRVLHDRRRAHGERDRVLVPVLRHRAASDFVAMPDIAHG